MLIEPKTFKEAMSCPNAEDWKLAVADELNMLEKRKAFKIVSRPKNKKTLGCRWIFKLKKDFQGEVKRFRARIVAQGFGQIPGIDYVETYSPVVNYTLIVLFMSFLGIGSSWAHRHADIKGAFLYGPLKEELYMEIPQGHELFSERNSKVMLLTKALYGLCQAGHEWYLELNKSLLELGFEKIKTGNCIYVLNRETIMLVYVDDIIIFSKTQKGVELTLKLLRSKFDIKDLGPLRKALGIEFEFTEGKWTMHQHAYIQKLKEEFKEIPFRKSLIPLPSGAVIQKASIESSVQNEVPYRNLIGSRMHHGLLTGMIGSRLQVI